MAKDHTSDTKRILVVDDEADVRDLVLQYQKKLRKEYQIVGAESVDEAIEILKKENINTVITDLVMPHKNGIELLNVIKAEYSHIPVIVISGNATPTMSACTIQSGAAHFLEKPIECYEQLFALVDNALSINADKTEIKRLNELLKNDFDASMVIGRSIGIQRVMEKVKRIANVDTTVFITGETGSGKDIFAQLIVANSQRKERKYVSVNCGSIPENLLESLLFGHKKGSFTSAYRDQVGYFEEANGGTIFLDEITETTIAFQTKLLRVLENKLIRKIGDNRDIAINVRIIAATNKNIQDEVKNGNFREDLYYRMNVIQIDIPPLRERIEDIEPLAIHFMKEYANKYKKPLYSIHPKAYAILCKHHWKGNVRELRNVIEHAVVMTAHDKIIPKDLPAYLTSDEEQTHINQLFNQSYTEAKENFDKQYIEYTLEKTNGDIRKTANEMQIHRDTLYEKIKKYDIKNDKYKNDV